MPPDPRRVKGRQPRVPDAPSALGVRLRWLREHAGLSQSQLADLAHVSRPIIGNVEAGKQQDMALSTARRLAWALGVSLDVLAGWDLPPP